ncbi:putative integral membrane protein (TIGR02206 family) [Marmoricola sp. URHA0025 HA25]
MAARPLVADGFEAFTPEHWALLALLVAGAVALGRVGAGHRGSPTEERFRRRFALLIPVFTVPFQVLQLLPGDFTLGTSLPLQVCDLSWMVAVWGLWTRDPRAVALLYFWGLTLTVQAAITPSLEQTFPDPRYFMFWGMHFLTIWAAVYLVCLAGGPGWRGYRLALWVTGLWAAVVLAFNAATGTNYGYLSRKPDTSSLLDVLGPWPAYLGVEVVILAVGWALMTWPWVAAGRTAPVRPSAGDRPPGQWLRRSIPPGLSARPAPPPHADEHTAGEEAAEARGQQER